MMNLGKGKNSDALTHAKRGEVDSVVEEFIDTKQFFRRLTCPVCVHMLPMREC
jgi:hypothetical protein